MQCYDIECVSTTSTPVQVTYDLHGRLLAVPSDSNRKVGVQCKDKEKPRKIDAQNFVYGFRVGLHHPLAKPYRRHVPRLLHSFLYEVEIRGRRENMMQKKMKTEDKNNDPQLIILVYLPLLFLLAAHSTGCWIDNMVHVDAETGVSCVRTKYSFVDKMAAA